MVSGEKPELPTECSRPPVSDASLLEGKMSADGTRSGEGWSSRGSTEREYDVFLGFRGSDSHKGIADQEHPMGSQFGSQLPEGIVRSKISIPTIFPYAASQWSYGKSTGRVVMPIFDGVENSHARHLTGSFWEAFFHAHKVCFEKRIVEAGQQGLRDVSFLQGWESEKITHGVVNYEQGAELNIGFS